MMIKKVVFLVVVALLVLSCKQENKFTITPNSIGPITKTTTVSELELLFENDSLVDFEAATQIKEKASGISVYEKGGKRLMRILPEEGSPESTIKSVKIYDERFTTEKGIGLSSTFKDINTKYTIKRIENLIDVIVIFVEESNAYFTIDKKHLAGDLMFNTSVTVEQTQIPDNTPIKFLMVAW